MVKAERIKREVMTPCRLNRAVHITAERRALYIFSYTDTTVEEAFTASNRYILSFTPTSVGAFRNQIDHLERELVQLTHKRDLASRGITNAAGISRSEKQGKQLNPPTSIDAGLLDSGKGLKRKSEDAYALEMHLQLKRAEREQRRHQLSAEFASTFADVSDKKQQLNRLNGALADIEATRLRKSREFSRLQVCVPCFLGG